MMIQTCTIHFKAILKVKNQKQQTLSKRNVCLVVVFLNRCTPNFEKTVGKMLKMLKSLKNALTHVPFGCFLEPLHVERCKNV